MTTPATAPTQAVTGKKAPAAFCAAHGLPDLTKWVSLDDEVTPRSVRKALHDKLLSYGDYIEHLIYPEGLTDGWESAVFTETEHEELAAFHKRLAMLDKDCVLLDIESTDADESAMIKRLVAEWPGIVAEMQRVVTKAKSAYNGGHTRHGPASYLG